MINTTDTEEKRSVAIIWIDGSDASGASDAVCGVLSEVVSGIFH
jgi:hypothetical protein